MFNFNFWKTTEKQETKEPELFFTHEDYFKIGKQMPKGEAAMNELKSFFTKEEYLTWVKQWKIQINDISDKIRQDRKIMQNHDNIGEIMGNAQSSREQNRKFASHLLDMRHRAKNQSWVFKQQEMIAKEVAA